MEQQALNLPGPRISRITLGRLHNLGNYEHVRYEVTVELPPGTSPASVARELEDTLNALEPKQPVSDWDLRQAVKTLALPEPVLDPKDDDDPFESPHEVLRRKQADRERARLHIERHEAWLKSRDAALRQFGNVAVIQEQAREQRGLSVCVPGEIEGKPPVLDG